MKTINARHPILIALLVLAVGMAVSRAGADRASAGTHAPAGNIPGDALNDLCSWQSLPPARHVWYRIPQGNDRQLIAALISYPRYIDRLSFQVYVARPAIAGGELDPWGFIGSSSKTDSRIALQWSGEAVDGELYYVDVANDNPFLVYYGLCNEARAFALAANGE